MENKNGAPSLI